MNSTISTTLSLQSALKEVDIGSTNAPAEVGRHPHKWQIELEDGKVSSLSCKLCEEYVDDITLVFGTMDVTVEYHTEVHTTMNSISPEYDFWIEVKNDTLAN